MSSDPIWRPRYARPGRSIPVIPSRGQCGSTALTIHDLLGGQLLIAEVLRTDGSRQGVHYWNLLPDGTRPT
jgi:hypothetical protein